MSKRKCIFCGRVFSINLKRSKEHVFPLWLHRALNKENTIIYTSHFRPIHKTLGSFFKANIKDLGSKKISQRKHLFTSLVYGLICEKCNNGFLNDIEMEVKQILLKIINYELCNLGLKEQDIISRWAFKTALILNISSNFEKYFFKNNFYNFFINKKPESCINISIARISSKAKEEAYWMQSRNIIFETTELTDYSLFTIIDRNSGIAKGNEFIPKQMVTGNSIVKKSFFIILNINGFAIKIFSIPTREYPIEIYKRKEGEYNIYPLIKKTIINWPIKNCFKNLTDFQVNTIIRFL